MTRKLKFTLLGTGSSGGVPRIGGDWGACDPSEPKNRRMRCSALVDAWHEDQAGTKTRVLIDTSPDFREQALGQDLKHLDGILLTHDHADQTHGLDDVRALVIRNRKQMPVYLDAPTRASLLNKFRYCFEGQGDYPPILDLQDEISALQPVTIDGDGGPITALPLDQRHGRISSLGFRFGPIAYCNDVDGLPDETINALGGLDVLIVDALRYTPHPSHAHLERALEWIEQIQPRRSVLTNLHVDMDYQTLVNELPSGVEPGFDGWSVTVDI